MESVFCKNLLREGRGLEKIVKKKGIELNSYEIFQQINVKER